MPLATLGVSKFFGHLLTIDIGTGWERIGGRSDVQLQTILPRIRGAKGCSQKDSAIRVFLCEELQGQFIVRKRDHRTQQSVLSLVRRQGPVLNAPVRFPRIFPTRHRETVKEPNPSLLELLLREPCRQKSVDIDLLLRDSRGG